MTPAQVVHYIQAGVAEMALHRLQGHYFAAHPANLIEDYEQVDTGALITGADGSRWLISARKI